MSSARVSYSARIGATSETEISALAAVYKCVLARREAALGLSRPDAGKEINERSGKISIPQQHT